MVKGIMDRGAKISDSGQVTIWPRKAVRCPLLIFGFLNL